MVREDGGDGVAAAQPSAYSPRAMAREWSRSSPYGSTRPSSSMIATRSGSAAAMRQNPSPVLSTGNQITVFSDGGRLPRPAAARLAEHHRTAAEGSGGDGVAAHRGARLPSTTASPGRVRHASTAGWTSRSRSRSSTRRRNGARPRARCARDRCRFAGPTIIRHGVRSKRRAGCADAAGRRDLGPGVLGAGGRLRPPALRTTRFATATTTSSAAEGVELERRHRRHPLQPGAHRRLRLGRATASPTC